VLFRNSHRAAIGGGLLRGHRGCIQLPATRAARSVTKRSTVRPVARVWAVVLPGHEDGAAFGEARRREAARGRARRRPDSARAVPVSVQGGNRRGLYIIRRQVRERGHYKYGAVTDAANTRDERPDSPFQPLRTAIRCHTEAVPSAAAVHRGDEPQQRPRAGAADVRRPADRLPERTRVAQRRGSETARQRNPISIREESDLEIS